jgi:hypothetical protein
MTPVRVAVMSGIPSKAVIEGAELECWGSLLSPLSGHPEQLDFISAENCVSRIISDKVMCILTETKVCIGGNARC